MQKKLIALAVAGLSTAAFAQIAPQNDQGASSVTIYGVADVSVQGTSLGQGVDTSTKPSGGATNLKSNSSLIGFKAVEDLGNGNSAIAQIETQVNLTGNTNGNNVASTSSGTTTATGLGALRDSGVGFSSAKYGTVIGGFWSTPYRQALVTADVMPGATGDGRIETLMGHQMVVGTQGQSSTAYGGLTSSVRASALAYQSPTLYGFNGAIAYTGNNNNGNMENNAVSSTYVGQTINGALSINATWTGYGVNVLGAFQQEKLGGTTTSGTSGTSATPFSGYTSYLLGAIYTGLPGLKASVVYNRNSSGVNTATLTSSTIAPVTNVLTNANKGSNNQVYAGVSYRFGNNEPRLAYAYSGNTAFNGANANDGAVQWTGNWGYYLSKRTQVYGLISGIKNNQNAVNNFAGSNTTNGSALVPAAGNTLLTYGVGMRTNF